MWQWDLQWLLRMGSDVAGELVQRMPGGPAGSPSAPSALS